MGKKKRGGAAKELPPEASTSQEHIDPGVLASALAVS
jgi:hypothetical protein